MASVSSGRSNVYNASARAKARKASLIDSTRMRQLLQQGPDSIGASIGELGYRAEMDLYASRMSGADAVEAKTFPQHGQRRTPSYELLSRASKITSSNLR